MLLGFVYSAFFLPRRPCQITFRTKFKKKINIRNIKMKLPVALFKKKSRKLFLKAKSQNLINTVVRCLHKEKDVKKTVKRKICKVRVLKINFFISYLSFKNNASLS